MHDNKDQDKDGISGGNKPADNVHSSREENQTVLVVREQRPKRQAQWPVRYC